MNYNPYQDDNIYNSVRKLKYDKQHFNYINKNIQSNEKFISRLQNTLTLSGHEGCVNRLKWNDDNYLLASASDDKRVLIWNVNSYKYKNKPKHTIDTGHFYNIFGLSYIDNDFIVTGSMDRQVRVHNIYNSSYKDVHKCHSDRVKHIATIPKHNKFVYWSCSEDGTVRQFDTREKHRCTPPDCKNVVINYNNVPSENKIHRYTPNNTNKKMNKFNYFLKNRYHVIRAMNEYKYMNLDFQRELKAIAVNPLYNNYIGVCSNDMLIRVYDRRMLKLCKKNKKMNIKNSIPSDTYYPKHLWNYYDEEDEKKLNQISLFCTHLAWSNDGKYLGVTYNNEHVYLFNFLNKEEERCLSYNIVDNKCTFDYTKKYDILFPPYYEEKCCSNNNNSNIRSNNSINNRSSNNINISSNLSNHNNGNYSNGNYSNGYNGNGNSDNGNNDNRNNNNRNNNNRNNNNRNNNNRNNNNNNNSKNGNGKTPLEEHHSYLQELSSIKNIEKLAGEAYEKKQYFEAEYLYNECLNLVENKDIKKVIYCNLAITLIQRKAKNDAYLAEQYALEALKLDPSYYKAIYRRIQANIINKKLINAYRITLSACKQYKGVIEFFYLKKKIKRKLYELYKDKVSSIRETCVSTGRKKNKKKEALEGEEAREVGKVKSRSRSRGISKDRSIGRSKGRSKGRSIGRSKGRSIDRSKDEQFRRRKLQSEGENDDDSYIVASKSTGERCKSEECDKEGNKISEHHLDEKKGDENNPPYKRQKEKGTDEQNDFLFNVNSSNNLNNSLKNQDAHSDVSEIEKIEYANEKIDNEHMKLVYPLNKNSSSRKHFTEEKNILENNLDEKKRKHEQFIESNSNNFYSCLSETRKKKKKKKKCRHVEEGVEAETGVEVDIEVEADVDAEVEADVDAEVEADVDAEVEADVDAEVEANVDAEVEADVDAEVEADVEAKVEAEAEEHVREERHEKHEYVDGRKEKFTNEHEKKEVFNLGNSQKVSNEESVSIFQSDSSKKRAGKTFSEKLKDILCKRSGNSSRGRSSSNNGSDTRSRNSKGEFSKKSKIIRRKLGHKKEDTKGDIKWDSKGGKNRKKYLHLINQVSHYLQNKIVNSYPFFLFFYVSFCYRNSITSWNGWPRYYYLAMVEKVYKLKIKEKILKDKNYEKKYKRKLKKLNRNYEYIFYKKRESKCNLNMIKENEILRNCYQTDKKKQQHQQQKKKGYINKMTKNDRSDKLIGNIGGNVEKCTNFSGYEECSSKSKHDDGSSNGDNMNNGNSNEDHLNFSNSNVDNINVKDEKKYPIDNDDDSPNEMILSNNQNLKINKNQNEGVQNYGKSVFAPYYQEVVIEKEVQNIETQQKGEEKEKQERREEADRENRLDRQTQQEERDKGRKKTIKGTSNTNNIRKNERMKKKRKNIFLKKKLDEKHTSSSSASSASSASSYSASDSSSSSSVSSTLNSHSRESWKSKDNVRKEDIKKDIDYILERSYKKKKKKGNIIRLELYRSTYSSLPFSTSAQNANTNVAALENNVSVDSAQAYNNSHQSNDINGGNNEHNQNENTQIRSDEQLNEENTREATNLNYRTPYLTHGIIGDFNISYFRLGNNNLILNTRLINDNSNINRNSNTISNNIITSANNNTEENYDHPHNAIRGDDHTCTRVINVNNDKGENKVYSRSNTGRSMIKGMNYDKSVDKPYPLKKEKRKSGEGRSVEIGSTKVKSEGRRGERRNEHNGECTYSSSKSSKSNKKKKKKSKEMNPYKHKDYKIGKELDFKCMMNSKRRETRTKKDDKKKKIKRTYYDSSTSSSNTNGVNSNRSNTNSSNTNSSDTNSSNTNASNTNGSNTNGSNANDSSASGNISSILENYDDPNSMPIEKTRSKIHSIRNTNKMKNRKRKKKNKTREKKREKERESNFKGTSPSSSLPSSISSSSSSSSSSSDNSKTSLLRDDCLLKDNLRNKRRIGERIRHLLEKRSNKFFNEKGRKKKKSQCIIYDSNKIINEINTSELDDKDEVDLYSSDEMNYMHKQKISLLRNHAILDFKDSSSDYSYSSLSTDNTSSSFENQFYDHLYNAVDYKDISTCQNIYVFEKKKKKKIRNYIEKIEDPFWVPQGSCKRFVGHCNNGTDIKEVAFWNDNVILAASDNCEVYVWRIRDGRLLNVLKGHENHVNCVQVHPEGSSLATSGIDKYIKIWQPNSKTEFDKSIQDTMMENQKSLELSNANYFSFVNFSPIIIK
ncbi:WD and tetratricopeptide repeats protein 1, putative [Plasmodium malariae]|uniref:WD and tetratricopeptide repeats protein 1, putative n=1 Tax=Plasmodium malariae TaxID=5858 RepID=A0A1D3TCT2_PLAMA|nr:WD and tetratricopeptide repeats protein 1, putative [Plasmodium malariae]SCP02670.1 WD and tetratricopeptide repeats protein 1, putative [Plasmodium malariae]